jgi:hypothetical protein
MANPQPTYTPHQVLSATLDEFDDMRLKLVTIERRIDEAIKYRKSLPPPKAEESKPA